VSVGDALSGTSSARASKASLAFLDNDAKVVWSAP